MTASTLQEAAGIAYDRLHVYWATNQLKTRVTFFWQQIIGPIVDQFPDGDQTARPVANWATVIAAISEVLPATDVPLAMLTQAAEAVYKICWIASYLAGAGQITSAQATAVLDAYNASFF